VRNRELEARPDVLTFTTGPLPAALDVAGAPVVELTISVDNPHADIFLRLCDVDEKGRSRNFSDRLQRLDPAVPAGQTQQLRLMLDHCFHRLAIGHRLRLQVSGGAFPRYARNLGTDGTLAEGSKLAPSAHTVHCAHSHLVLPLAHPVRTGGASTTP
jgi:putative CocE/NonD family hydrolase